MLSNIASGLPSALSCSLAISISFSIISLLTESSFNAMGFIAATCIATFFETSETFSNLLDNPARVAILFPA